MNNVYAYSNTRNPDLQLLHQVDFSLCYVVFESYLIWNNADVLFFMSYETSKLEMFEATK